MQKQIPNEINLRYNENQSNRIIQIEYSGKYLGFVFEDGKVAILQIHYKTQNENKKENIKTSETHLNIDFLKKLSELPEDNSKKGEWLIQVGATCIEFSKKYNVVAVGHESGEVSLFQSTNSHYSVFYSSNNERPAQSFDILRIFSLIHWGISPTDTGKVQKLSWSPDGSVLAIGWAERGISVWSIYGCRLMCSIPQLEGCKSTNYTVSHSVSDFNENEIFKKGINSFTWGDSGFSLLIICNLSHENFYQINFIKNALHLYSNVSFSKYFVLYSSDKLYLLDKKRNHLQVNNSMSHSKIPQTYLQDNWPIKYISINRKQSDIAIAGKKGFITFNRKKKYWRVFADQTQEQSITPVGICWFHHNVLVSSFDEKSKKFEILAFPHDYLSFSSLLLRMQILQDKVPIAIDCNEHHLVVFTKDAFFLQYVIQPVYAKSGKLTSLQCTLQHQICVSNINSIASLLLLPNNFSKAHVSDKVCKCIFLDESGKLSYYDGETQQDTELGVSIEQFWYSNNNDTLINNVIDPDRRPKRTEVQNDHDELTNHLQNYHLSKSIWSYGENGINIWFHDDRNNEFIELNPQNQSFEFDTEVYPFGYSPDIGVVIGASQAVTYSNSSPYPRFDINIRSHPFLHVILRHLLTNQNLELALHVAQQNSFIPYFSHSLELLLHDILELVDSNRKSQNTLHLFSLTIKFLQYFWEYPKIIVDCARKIDAVNWDILFLHAGNPLDLFNSTIQRNFLNSAASYLRIIEIVNSVSEARHAGFILLKAYLHNDDLSVIPDLLRFLDPTRLTELNDNSFSGSIEDEEYAIDIILSGYSRKLISSFNLGLLLEFTVKTPHPLHYWLSKEKSRAAVFSNYSVAINAIHAFFKIPPYNFNLPPEDQLLTNLALQFTPRQVSSNTSFPSVVENFYPQPEINGTSIQETTLKLERVVSDPSINQNSPRRSMKNSPGVTFVGKPPQSPAQQYISPEVWVQLELLLIETYNSQCFDLALVLGCVMLHIPVILKILHHYPSKWQALNSLSKHSA